MPDHYTFDLVAERPIKVDEQDWSKVRFHLSEFQPATKVILLDGESNAIRVYALGGAVEVAPGLLRRVEELIGQQLTYRSVENPDR